MKHNRYFWLGISLFMALATLMADAQNQSLGDVARAAKKQSAQKAAETKHFDNDNLPRNEHISVVGGDATSSSTDPTQPAAEQDGAAAANGGEQSVEKKTDDGSAPRTAVDEKKAANADWQKKLEGQKGQIDLLSRELDVIQREYQLRAAAMYADAGNRLRNAGAWDKEDASYKQKIADKQKALTDAKQKLDDMQEQARKAGVPSSMRE